MVKLTVSDIEKVADLAKIKLTDSEIKTFTPQLSKVVDYISELSEVNTKNIEPVSQTTGLVNIIRKDEIQVTRILNQDEATSGTDNVTNGYFVVERLVKK